MPSTIRLIVGLGNPGPEYISTRHNVGAWFVDRVAHDQGATLRAESKFFGCTAKVSIDGQNCWLLFPTTYMNESGRAVKALASFYKIAPQEILVAHDELDFDAGIIRVKQGGGHGGHNGLRDIIRHLGTPDFCRLRIGIGHPGHRDKVTPYVLSAPSKSDAQKIITSLDDGLRVLTDLVSGDIESAQRYLHN